MSKAKIALSMIIKDDSELEIFKESLYSVLPYVQFAQITSNGKKTTEIEAFIESTRGTFPKITIDYTHLPWTDDFSAQRNHSFNRIPKDYDYIYWQDADDILVGGDLLQNVAEIGKRNGKDVIFLVYWYGCEFSGKPSLETFKAVDIQHYRERLIRPGVITWKGRLHETPVPVDGQKNNYTKVEYNPKERPIAVMHTALIDDAKEKMLRNKRILELQLEEERKNGEADPRTILYLMKIYAEIGNKDILEECIEMGKEYLEKSGWDEERANCYDLMAICSSKLGLHQDSVKFLHSAIREYPHQPLHYVRLAMAYFEVGRFRECRHWLEVASTIELDSKTAGINNIKELKVLMTQLVLKLKFQVEKDIDGAVEAAQALLKEQPSKENEENLYYLMDRKELKDASEAALKLFEYFEMIGDNESTLKILDSLPLFISEQPFAISHRRRISKPRLWKDNEICYFANFGGKHFEKWDSNSLAKGIGGSETAVIELSKRWTEMGYKVFVYGDPEQVGEQDGVTYLPWYYFNQADKFNIFIQWRNASLAPVIKAKKFLVDLHDVVNQVDYPDHIVNAVDKIMVKSKYHKDMLPDVPKEKIAVVGNGIVI